MMPYTFKRDGVMVTVPGTPQDYALLRHVEARIACLEADGKTDLPFEELRQHDIALTAAYAERRAIWSRLHD